MELSDCAKCILLTFIIWNIPVLVRNHIIEISSYSLHSVVFTGTSLENLYCLQLCGLASLAIGIWLVVEDSQIEEVSSEVNTRIGASLFITIGVLLTILPCLGILGVCCKLRMLMLLVSS